MLLTITTTLYPATALGFALRKHPDRAQRFALSFGEAHVLWPEASEDRATCAMIVDVDPVALVRGRQETPGSGPLAAYVNDRPYTASTFLGVAISQVFGTALNDADLAPWPLEVTVAAVRRPGGELARRLFEPLGYELSGVETGYGTLTLRGTISVRDALRHLYLLLPALDGHAHHWVGKAEVDKLVSKGGQWLESHPDRGVIVRRYLQRQRGLTRSALAKLAPTPPEADEQGQATHEVALEKPLRLNTVRLTRVVELLQRVGAHRVVDLGCGEGKLLERLLKQRQFTEIIGIDASPSVLDRAEKRLDGRRGHQGWRQRLRLLHGSATYRDDRIREMDAVTLVEVIEHVDPARLPALVDAVFGHAHPRVVVVTTPNVEYNAVFEMPPGKLRHGDHRFEWDRATFEGWANDVAQTHGYSVSFEMVGELHPTLGAPTQMGVFQCV